MKSLIAFLLLFVSINCFAQKQDVYFVKDDGSYVTHLDSADYIRIIKEPAPGSDYFGVSEYYPDGKLKRVGESSAPNYPKLVGTCISYYPNGNRKAVNIYRNSALTGLQYEFFPNGKAYIAKTHTPDQKNPLNPGIAITSNYDSLGKVLVVDGNGHFIKYDKDFKYVAEEGDLKNSLKEGEWKFKEDSVTAVELYRENKFISGTSNLNGDIKKYTAAAAPPTLKGGTIGFLQYLGDNIHYPATERQRNIQGKVVVSFVIEKDGTLSKIKVIQSVSSNMDAEAVRVVKKSPKWTPGIQFGRAVSASFIIPINFSLGYSR